MDKAAKKRAYYIILFGIALILVFMFDSQIVRIVSELRNSLLDEVFLGVTFISSEILVFFILTSFFLWEEKKRRWIFPLWATLAISAIINILLKIIVQRPRPFSLGIVQTLPILAESHFFWDSFSFVSFHAMLVFCAIPILAMEFKKLKYFWIAFAVIVSFSRVYFGLHFLSDVMVGALLGFIIGEAIVEFEREKLFFWNLRARRRVRITREVVE